MLYLAIDPNRVHTPREPHEPLAISVFDTLDAALNDVKTELLLDEYFITLDPKSLHEASLEWVQEVH